jgi:hypothetical protein
MQTFLPYPNAWASARCLDNKRLGKQRVECKQILLALGIDVGEHRGNPESRWRHHPAVRMWRSHELYLADLVRTACIIATMAVAASLIVEVRFRLAAIEVAARPQPQAVTYGYAPAPPAPEPGRLARFGRATLDLADAALGVVR